VSPLLEILITIIAGILLLPIEHLIKLLVKGRSLSEDQNRLKTLREIKIVTYFFQTFSSLQLLNPKCSPLKKISYLKNLTRNSDLRR
jgi:hypothetical protein